MRSSEASEIISYRVIMVPPLGLLRVGTTGLDIVAVVWWSLLFFARGEHRDDRKADGLHRECRGPVFSEDAEADVAVGIDVGMDRDIFTHEDHLRRIKRVFG